MNNNKKQRSLRYWEQMTRKEKRDVRSRRIAEARRQHELKPSAYVSEGMRRNRNALFFLLFCLAVTWGAVVLFILFVL